MNKSVVIRNANLSESEDIANIYIKSFKAALPSVKLAHSDSEIRQWYKQFLIPKGGTYVAEEDSKIIGFMTLDGNFLEELYLSPQVQGKGIGSMLMNKAKQLSPGGLKTYTFQVNNTARKFYEKHGFNAVSLNDGSRNEEHEPDILYEWKPNS